MKIMISKDRDYDYDMFDCDNFIFFVLSHEHHTLL